MSNKKISAGTVFAAVIATVLCGLAANVFAQSGEPRALIVYPQGGEFISAGQKVTLQWTHENTDKVSIYYYDSSNYGKPIFPHKTMDAGSTSGTAEWTVPEDFPTRSDMFLKITAMNAAAGAKSAYSGTFSIIGRGGNTGIVSNARVTSSSGSEIIIEWYSNIMEKSTLHWAGGSCNPYADIDDKQILEGSSKFSHKAFLDFGDYNNICFQVEDSTGDRTEVLSFAKPSRAELAMSAIAVTPSENSVQISWVTDHPAMGAVYAKPATSSVTFYDSPIAAFDSTPTTTHKLFLYNLSAETGYYLRVESVTADGRLASNKDSETNSFRTLASNALPDFSITELGKKHYEGDNPGEYIFVKILNSGRSIAVGDQLFLRLTGLESLGGGLEQGYSMRIEPETLEAGAIFGSGSVIEARAVSTNQFDKTQNYEITAVIDKAENFKESNESNNSFASTLKFVIEEVLADDGADNKTASNTDSSLSTGSPKNLTAHKISDDDYFARLRGRIILRVESKGEAYYINPADKTAYYLGRPDDAFRVMREKGIGITDADLRKIPMGLVAVAGPDSDGDGLADLFEDAVGTDKTEQDSDGDGFDDKTEIGHGYDPAGAGKLVSDADFGRRHSGKIFLQAQKHGEAWFIDPAEGKRYFLGRPADAFAAMRALGIGITEADFSRLTDGA